MPTNLRQYVTHADWSEDFYLTLPRGAPIELRYARTAGGTSLTAIVPDVGMADGLPCWVWSSTSRRVTLPRFGALNPHWERAWATLITLATLRHIEHATLMQHCQAEQERRDAPASYQDTKET